MVGKRKAGGPRYGLAQIARAIGLGRSSDVERTGKKVKVVADEGREKTTEQGNYLPTQRQRSISRNVMSEEEGGLGENDTPGKEGLVGAPASPSPSSSSALSSDEATTSSSSSDLSSDSERGECSGENSGKAVVLHHYNSKALAPELKKYWHQRHRLFSLYDEGILMDDEGWWSVTPENIAAHIAERCRARLVAPHSDAPFTVLDAMTGVGGNAIQFAQAGARVVAIDIDEIRLGCAKHNSEIYQVDPWITFIHADWMQWVQRNTREKFDMVFLSPPWGGIDYMAAGSALDRNGVHTVAETAIGQPDTQSQAGKNHIMTRYNLSMIRPASLQIQLQLAKSITKANNVALYLPRNCDPFELALLDPANAVEVEYQYHDENLKALCVYFGDLGNHSDR